MAVQVNPDEMPAQRIELKPQSGRLKEMIDHSATRNKVVSLAFSKYLRDYYFENWKGEYVDIRSNKACTAEQAFDNFIIQFNG